MKALCLLRHAKAAPQSEGDDRDRPLDENGRRAARRLAAWLAERQLTPALVLCSTAARARETLDLVLPAFARPPQILHEDGLYLAEARRLLARLRQVPPDTPSVLMVGHNPGMQELAALLADATAGPLATRLAENFPAGALARYELDIAWAALDRRRARLVAYITPKELSAVRR
jgi:phosphohistidine phosphatase